MTDLMYIQYNSNDRDSVVLTEGAPVLTRDGKGRPYLRVRTFSIEGKLFADSHSEFLSKIDALKTDFSYQNEGLNFKLYWGNDDVTDININGTTALAVRITEPPHLNKGDGPVYANGAWWPYKMGIEVTEELIALVDPTRNLIAFSETIEPYKSTEVPRVKDLETITGPAQKFTVCAKPLIVATHKIRMTGWFTKPVSPGPFVAHAALVTEGPIPNELGASQKYDSEYRFFDVEYTYRYESPTPIDFTGLIRNWI